jgi:hypothetical protein
MTAKDRETLADLRDAVVEINDELESAMDDLVELKARVEAIKFLKAKPVTK